MNYFISTIQYMDILYLLRPIIIIIILFYGTVYTPIGLYVTTSELFTLNIDAFLLHITVNYYDYNRRTRHKLVSSFCYIHFAVTLLTLLQEKKV